ncbi:MAG: hypothetical protein QOG85_1968 [Gaiellaceae bacterium]|jgi:hypothetical protein|nr:hypothetical protein [Gaiellaceae bacterium]
MVALALVLGGTAVAATTVTYLTKTSGTTLIKHLAPTLTVKKARGPAALASGQTEYGTIGSQPPETGTGAGDEIGDNASLPFRAPVALDNEHVQIAGVDGTPTQCPGTAAAPSAAAGYVCIYPYSQSNADLAAGYIWSSQTSKYGFQMSWNSASGGLSYVFANWAYKAP